MAACCTAFFGGSFDPPHIGHVLAAAYLAAVGPFDRVFVVPVWAHAFDKKLATFEHRLEMCRRAFSNQRLVEVSDVERSLGAPSLTSRTLEHLVREHPTSCWRLVIGADVLQDTPKWHAFERVSELAPPYVLGRAGYEAQTGVPALLPEVSSSRIRQLLERDTASIEGDEVRRSLPRDVLSYIEREQLYRARGGP